MCIDRSVVGVAPRKGCNVPVLSTTLVLAATLHPCRGADLAVSACYIHYPPDGGRAGMSSAFSVQLLTLKRALRIGSLKSLRDVTDNVKADR